MEISAIADGKYHITMTPLSKAEKTADEIWVSVMITNHTSHELYVISENPNAQKQIRLEPYQTRFSNLIDGQISIEKGDEAIQEHWDVPDNRKRKH